MYYYYHTLARTLRAYGEPTIQDAAGQSHDWRVELIDKVASLQKPDGSWAGERKWMEDNPVLTTSYVLLALEEALASLDGK
jgi:squalene-hopene/tetraprenyl-beta-curcumene cyclase